MKKESIELAEGLNKLYYHIRYLGDFSLEGAGADVLAFKKLLDEKYNKLNVEIMGMVANILQEHSEADISFIPLEDEVGVAVQYSFKTTGQVKLNKDGKKLNETKRVGINEVNREN